METLRDEELTRGLLEPTPESLAAVLVFPLIPNLRRDVWVRLPLSKICQRQALSHKFCCLWAFRRPLVRFFVNLKSYNVTHCYWQILL